MELKNLSDPLAKQLRDRHANLDEQLSQRGIVLPQTQSFKTDLDRALLFSEFIASTVTRTPEILVDLIESKDLEQAYGPNTFGDRLEKDLTPTTDETDFKAILTRLRQREMVRIAWQDLTGTATLERTTTDLSALAEACVDKTFTLLYDKLCFTHGTPLDRQGSKQEIAVIGMGKLGARELNFSSDIDLIFAYPWDGIINGNGKSSTNEEFFTKLCRNFLRVFDSTMAETTIFRVDTRLRPFGSSGPLVASFGAMVDYYQTQGREWERYALIKARPIAGDIPAGNRLLKSLNPFVYRRYLDYGSFESFRDMKKRISLQVKDKKFRNNIKIGPGGIREIEFFGQLFQLIRGGVEPEFQAREILKILTLLNQRAYIDDQTLADLSDAYVFLRRVEHRLQEYGDLQTHDLPEDPTEQSRLALSMGFDTWPMFAHVLNRHLSIVHTHFNHLLVEKKQPTPSDTNPLSYLWQNLTDPQFDDAEAGCTMVNNIPGFKDKKTVIRLLKSLEANPSTRRLTANGRNRLNRLVPKIIQKAGEQPHAETVLARLVDLVVTIEQRTCYLSLLLEKPDVLDQIAGLAAKSPWIIGFLSKHPALLDELLGPGKNPVLPTRDELRAELERRMSQIPPSDQEFQIEELCLFKHTNTLGIAVADVNQDYPLMKVSDSLTYVAETVLERVIDIAWDHIAEKYGTPSGMDRKRGESPGFAAIAYGKLGGIELGYKSDLDLVFIHSGGEGTTRGGKKDIEITRFYSMLGQRIIHALTVHTPAGTLYETDMRLRPSGQSGMIVSEINAFETYINEEAWTWEIQAIVRARPIAGDPELQDRFTRVRDRVLRKQRDPLTLKREVKEMRERLRKKHLKSGVVDLKQGKGGIVDIEFLVQYLVLRYSHDHPALTRWTDNVRIIETLALEKILTDTEAEQIKQAYLVQRRAIHRLNLKEEEETRLSDHFFKIKEWVFALYEKILL
ncbi:GlnE [Desulforapulum autotrophicum HRM2]|uniref:GlnE n=1 Tax=Desulforapulum autotrophicum (strain ATCC 43914 / DSM 3382 / VKM B-1955 / HRM2) TaxID=177437 RepID=C0QHH1_DESAH|nr:bifunctional [glutamate--ammonia ligase]-adenylyl-L-tyrosine phosphorylase/[glutamate--ammonia-ligase] adenylyltransferase [Desulforapulum autotrophicum]ACN17830.1 GlnE [Desulforapulum autotrophicum HRM2]